MPEHKCIQDDRIRDLMDRMTRQEEKTDTTEKTLAKIEAFQAKLMWTMFGVLISSIGSLVLLLFQLGIKR